MSERASWDEYFMKLAHEVASRSTCLRRKVGAVAVNERNRIIATGYNGPPSGMRHCTPDTCIRTKKNIPSGKSLDLCKAIHAEANIVLSVGPQLEDATIYITNQPCTSCLKLLMGAHVKKIMWDYGYADDYAMELMGEYGQFTLPTTEMEAIRRPVLSAYDSWPGFGYSGIDELEAGVSHHTPGVLIRRD